LNCQICGEEFEREKGLHLHLSKKHEVPQERYYHTYYPRYDLYTKGLIVYKNREDYFSRYFNSEDALRKWLKTDSPERQRVVLSILQKRIEDKDLEFAPSHVELKSLKLTPTLFDYRNLFGTYGEAVRHLNKEPLLSDSLDYQIPDKDPVILVDTREQKPFKLPKSKAQKLAFGDYTLDAENFTHTFIDRKSESDFKGTFTIGFDRFVKECERAALQDCFIYILVESSISKIQTNNYFYPVNLDYLFHNMRHLMHQFPRKIQFVFAENRTKATKLVKPLLCAGKQLWTKDVQFILEEKGFLDK